MTALYERSDARRASYRRWYDTEGGRASRARHEATRGYLRKRTKQLIASRSRTAAQIAALEQEAKCQRQ